MDEVVIGALQRVLRECGVEVLGDVRRLEALLRDHCPNSRPEVNLVVLALKERVPQDLQSGAVTSTMLRARLVRRLEEHYFLPNDAATRAVDSWLMALCRAGWFRSPAALPPETATDSAMPSNALSRVGVAVDSDWASARTAGAVSVNPTDGATCVWVPPGRFTMGSPPGGGFDNERPAHLVTISRGFWLYEHPVTNEQYGRYMRSRVGMNEPTYWADDRFNSCNQPVVGVSWDDANAYAWWAGVRLPTEAEWEYAARGQDGMAYPWGNNLPDARRAVFGGRHGAHTIGGRPGGASWCGVHDMAGNVWEWCSDWFNNRYPRGQLIDCRDPTGPESGDERVVRGGAWCNGPLYLRSAGRYSYATPARYDFVGFRLVRSAESQR